MLKMPGKLFILVFCFLATPSIRGGTLSQDDSTFDLTNEPNSAAEYESMAYVDISNYTNSSYLEEFDPPLMEPIIHTVCRLRKIDNGTMTYIDEVNVSRSDVGPHEYIDYEEICFNVTVLLAAGTRKLKMNTLYSLVG